MPKLFPIHVEVEELAVGKVMRLLHNTPGVAKVNLNLGEPKPKANGARKPYGPRKKYETSGNDEIVKLLSNTNRSTPELASDFDALGRSPVSVNSAIHTLQKAGEVKRTPDGLKWMLTKKAKDRLRQRKQKKK